MTAGSGQGLRRKGFGWALWVVLGIVWFATMPFRPLLDPDEGRYAEIPREMAASGDWITPRLNGFKYFEKPPLQYWATAAAYSVFGFSKAAARLWTVGLAFLCLPMVFGWTARLYGKAAGIAATAVLAVSPYYELIAHLNLLDAGFSFWMAGALFAFTLGQCAPQGSGSERRWVLLSWVAAALGVLSKGIVVGVLTGGTLVIYSLVERDTRIWRRLRPWPGVAVFLLITAPWFIAVTLKNPSFPGFFFIHEHFARFLTTVHKRTEPWWYFLALLLIGALPWLAVLPGALRAAWFESTRDIPFKPLKFLAVFCGVTLVFFSISESKLAPYILPMFPALAAAVGVYVADRPTFVRTLARVNGFLLPLLAGALVIYAQRRFGFLPSSAVPWLSSAALIALYGVIATCRRDWMPWAAWATAASAILGWQCLLSAYTELPERSSERLVMTVQSQIGPETELFTIGQYRETLSAYLQRTLEVVDFEGELQFGLAEEPARKLTPERFLERWRQAPQAVAFVPPALLDEWQARGLQGKVIGGDNQTLVIGTP